MRTIFTEVIKANEPFSSDVGILKAGELLKRGELVGIPTETVYGLAANALDDTAVLNIFKAKGRPQDNPLIVHVADIDSVNELVLSIPQKAIDLFHAFWPGPLTVILKKSEKISDVVSGGLDTVAIRFPSDPAAQAIIKAAGVPIAAPSANLSGRPSPTRAEHVFDDLNGKIPLIIDAGECGVGLESTVITLAQDPPRLLRPGGITTEQIERVIGPITVDKAVLSQIDQNEKVSSPGMKYKHYSPKCKVFIVEGDSNSYYHFVNSRQQEDSYALCFNGDEENIKINTIPYGSEQDSLSQAQNLFNALRLTDKLNAKIVYARCPSKNGVGLAVYNRLIRAAGFEVIKL